MIRMPLRCASLAASLLILAGAAFAVPAFGARHPALSPDGSEIAFSWQGDLWIVSSAGGDARRLTVHQAYDHSPSWSPDGREIAFSSNRHGNDDIFVASVRDGFTERLTFHSDDDQMQSWSPDGKTLYFGSNRESRAGLIYAVSRAGGRPLRVTGDRGFGASVSPDGKWLAYVRGYSNWWRKHYRGPASRDIWVRALSGGPSQHIVAWQGTDDRPFWSPDGRSLYFQSEREDGVKNLWRQDLLIDGERVDPAGSPVRLTNLPAEGSVQYLNVSRDGSLAVFEQMGTLWTVPTSGGGAKQLGIECGGDQKQNEVVRSVMSSGATEFAFAPGEKQIAFVVEGELDAALVDDGELKDAVRLTATDAREKDIAWLDEKALIYVSDRYGSDDLFRMFSTDKDEERLGKSRYRNEVRLTLDQETENHPQVSPDGETVLYRKGTRVLWTMKPDGTNQKRLLETSQVLHADWAPDSRWVAYSITTHGSAEDIFICDVESGETVNVSNHPADDFHPLWSGDGKRLAWASRTDDGFYSVKYLWLTHEEADKSDAEREREEEEKDADDESKKDKKDKKDDADEETEVEATPPVRIDWDDLSERVRTVTTVRGFYWDYDQSPDGKHFALRTDLLEGQMELWTVDWDGDNLRRMTKGGANPTRMLWSEDSESVRFVGGGAIKSIKNEADASPETLGFSAELTVNGRERRLQKFNEAWRLLEDGFYDANFHGVDWGAIRVKYRRRAEAAVMYEDFKDVIREMIGELNASHLGTWGGPSDATGDDRTGLLGFTPDDSHTGEGVRVARVLPRGPLDREGRRVMAGDTILAIDGVRIAPGANYYPLLNHKRAKEVDLLVRAEDGEELTITVEPVGSVREMDYRAWMDTSRSMVEKQSGGRLGYLHMSGMGDDNWDQFVADMFSRANGKDGLILDIRFNGGGSIHDQVLTFLSRRPYCYSIGRGDPDIDFNSIERFDGPIVLLINEASYSDAEIFPAGFKELGLGRVVGMPTFGAVIGTNNVPLIDGTMFRIPGTGWYRMDGRNLENDPVTPDILVPSVPEENLRNRDAQLEAGIAECLRMLSERG